MKAFLILCITLAVMLACDAYCTSGNGGNDGSDSDGSGGNDGGYDNNGNGGNGSEGNNSSGNDKTVIGGAAAAGENPKTKTQSGFNDNGDPKQDSQASASNGAVASGGLATSN